MNAVFEPEPERLYRYPLLIAAAVALNLLLFYLILEMVGRGEVRIEDREASQIIEFVRLQPPKQPPPEKRETPPPRPPLEREPPPPELPRPEIPKPAPMPIKAPQPHIDVPLAVGGIPYLGDFMKSAPAAAPVPAAPVADIATDVVPTVKIPPTYPPRALRAGIEGHVTVEFTIAADGSVKDPVIVDAEPPEIFDDAVLHAIVKWKFNPEIADGQPVEKRARQVVRFKLQR